MPDLQEKKPKRLFRFVGLYWRQLKRYMVTGLMVWVPLIITLWITWYVFVRLGLGFDKLMQALVEQFKELARENRFFGWLSYIEYMPGMGFLIAIALFLTTGFLARYLVGRRIIQAVEGLLDRIPFISRIYRAVQQIRDVFVNREGTVFQKVCLVEYPRKDMIVVGFVTSHEQGMVQQAMGRELVAVFIPTTPNPTSGFLVYVPPEEVTIIPMSVEDAMKLIISGGAYVPATHSVPPQGTNEAGDGLNEGIAVPNPD
jgi:uncharacterized membrane protein